MRRAGNASRICTKRAEIVRNPPLTGKAAACMNYIMKPSKKSLQSAILRIKRELAALGDLRPGSLSIQTRKWGGEYCQLSYTHRSKGHTLYIPPQRRKTVERQIANYRNLRELINKWIDLEVELRQITDKEEGEE
jgi:hypothetical protein